MCIMFYLCTYGLEQVQVPQLPGVVCCPFWLTCQLTVDKATASFSKSNLQTQSILMTSTALHINSAFGCRATMLACSTSTYRSLLLLLKFSFCALLLLLLW